MKMVRPRQRALQMAEDEVKAKLQQLKDTKGRLNAILKSLKDLRVNFRRVVHCERGGAHGRVHPSVEGSAIGT